MQAVCLLVFTPPRVSPESGTFCCSVYSDIASGVVFAVLAVSLAGSRVSEAFVYPCTFLVSMAGNIIATALVNALIGGPVSPALVHSRDKNPAGGTRFKGHCV
jgi:hypothetical protein